MVRKKCIKKNSFENISQTSTLEVFNLLNFYCSDARFLNVTSAQTIVRCHIIKHGCALPFHIRSTKSTDVIDMLQEMKQKWRMVSAAQIYLTTQS